MPEDAFHQRLKRHRGKASAHPCISCGGAAVEWAYQHGGDPLDEQGYSPMCRSCHRKLDHSKGTPLPFTPGNAGLPAEVRQQRIAAAVKASASKRRIHKPGCDRSMRVKSLASGGGRSCPCGARWVCL